VTFKLHTFLRGVIWEGLGIIMLFLYAYVTNSADIRSVAIGWPIFRALTYYPYACIYKWIYNGSKNKNLY